MQCWAQTVVEYLNALKAASRLRCVQKVRAWRLRAPFWAASLIALKAEDRRWFINRTRQACTCMVTGMCSYLQWVSCTLNAIDKYTFAWQHHQSDPYISKIGWKIEAVDLQLVCTLKSRHKFEVTYLLTTQTKVSP